jgi:hypothetical protein
MRHSKASVLAAIVLAAGLSASLAPNVIHAAGNEVAAVTVGSGGLSLAPHVDYEKLIVTVSGPDDFALRQEFDRAGSGFVPLVDAAGGSLADGTYAYELRAVPHVDEAVRAALKAAREAGDAAAEARLAARLPQAAPAQSGFFTILGGSVVPGDLREPKSAPAAAKAAPTPDTTFTDSLCVGFDCPASPSFSDTTILMMENNTRIKYDDTSVSAGFPNRDWALNANDSASGGSNRFWIQDCGNSSQGGCSGNAVMSIEAGARNNALYVDDGGRLGLGTSNPVLDIHDVRGNTPSIRLEQDGSSGFTAQTWDIAGNEANFFVRDVTSGSRLPFRIRPGAPTSSIDISATGSVGVGTASPSAPLHVRRTDGTSKLLVEEASATAADRVLMTLQNTAANNKSRFLIQSGTGGDGIWTFDNNGQALNSFSIVKVGSGTTAFTLNANGNLTIAGTLTQNSDRNTKDAVQAVDAHAVLAKVGELPISTWHFKTDDRAVMHMGPMAQDFAAAFGLGEDERHIAPVDMGGVALAAIKALNEVVSAKDAEIAAQRARLDELAQRNAELAARLAAIEQALGTARR